MSRKKNTIIIVGGPTAVGKTDAAIQLALHFNTSILSADSRQCYREMDIGVAKPGKEELDLVPHYFINSHSIHDNVDVVVYEKYALEHLDLAFEKSKVVVVVGGTGLYIKALCEGLDEMPEIAAELRQELRTTYEEKGIEWLQEALKKQDPLFYEQGEIQNPQRGLRALEFVLTTGESIKSYQKKAPKERPFNIIKIGLEMERALLNERINKRVDIMMENGQLEEVKGLLPFADLNALQTVGYSEIFAFLNGEMSLELAVEKIKTNTRRYAKRQMTWFKNQDNFEWFGPTDIENMLIFIKSTGYDCD